MLGAGLGLGMGTNPIRSICSGCAQLSILLGNSGCCASDSGCSPGAAEESRKTGNGFPLVGIVGQWNIGKEFLSVREQLSERTKQEPLVSEDQFAWPKQLIESQL